MGASTQWGTEKHHSDYESYVDVRTGTYQSELNSYLVFDGNLTVTSTYDAAVAVARDTTFDHGGALTCTWMDQHYNWSDTQFKNRAGESLNLATNAVADVLHVFYTENIAPVPTVTSTTASTPSIPEFSAEAASFMLLSALVTTAVLLRRKTKN
jgi:hypothetical protein